MIAHKPFDEWLWRSLADSRKKRLFIESDETEEKNIVRRTRFVRNMRGCSSLNCKCARSRFDRVRVFFCSELLEKQRRETRHRELPFYGRRTDGADVRIERFN